MTAEELILLIDGVQDYAICMLDPEGRVVIWNEGARLVGCGISSRRSSAFTRAMSSRWSKGLVT